MADPIAVAALRLLIAEPVNEVPYTDEDLSGRLDLASSADEVAYQIWTEKAAKYAQLVDISEGGSSRKNGELHEQALRMAGVFGERATSATVPPTSGVRVSRLARP